MVKQEQGFTLVELAISLVVIGLLLGAMLKGREILDNVQVTRTVAQLRQYEAAIQTFFNTYEVLPGDMQGAGNVLPDCTAAGSCNVDGNGDFRLANFGSETFALWTQLQRAGLLPSFKGNWPEAAFGSRVYAGWLSLTYPATGTWEGHRFIIQREGGGGTWTSAQIRMLERKTGDDDRPYTGGVRVQYLANSPCVDLSGNYAAGNMKGKCVFYVEFDPFI